MTAEDKTSTGITFEIDDPRLDTTQIASKWWEAFYEAEEGMLGERLQGFNPMYPFTQTQPGDIIPVRRFSFTPLSQRETVIPTDTPGIFTTENHLVLDVDGQLLRLNNSPRLSSYRLQQKLASSGNILAKVEEVTGNQERTLRTGFPPPSEADSAIREFETLTTLSQEGYPVPQGARLEQLFLPWNDSLSYNWIEGESLGDRLEKVIKGGDLSQANELLRLFGQHIQIRWGDLLEGRVFLPGGKTYVMPDNVLGSFIYTDSANPRDAFVRIDLGGLEPTRSPLGLGRMGGKLLEDLKEDNIFVPHQETLIESFRQGIFLP